MLVFGALNKSDICFGCCDDVDVCVVDCCLLYTVCFFVEFSFFLSSFILMALVNAGHCFASLAVCAPPQLARLSFVLFFVVFNGHWPGSCWFAHLTQRFGRKHKDPLWLKRWHRLHCVIVGFFKYSYLTMCAPIFFFSNSDFVSVFGCSSKCHIFESMLFFLMCPVS